MQRKTYISYCQLRCYYNLYHKSLPISYLINRIIKYLVMEKKFSQNVITFSLIIFCFKPSGKDFELYKRK